MVDLVRRAQNAVRGASTVAGIRPGVPGIIGQATFRFFRSLNIWFWAIVGIPTILAGIYYFAIAANMYSSDAEFVVHGPSRNPLSALQSMFSGASQSGAQDTQIVSAFIQSRDAVRKLEQNDQLRAVFSRPEGDFLTRFPGFLFWRKDFEALYRTYGHFVSVDIDASSGIAVLQVKAYRPEDAQRIAKALIADSEQLVNDLNARARHDALATFQEEVNQTQQHLAALQKDLTAYRIKAKMLDPAAEAKGPYTLLAQLNTQEASAKAQLTDALRNAPHSPQIALLRTRLASLDKLIADERAKITGGGDSVATAMTQYEWLNLQSEIEQKILAQAVAAREQAKLAAERQQLYLETIAQPNLADYPLFPKRLVSFSMVVGSCLLAYGIAWLLISGVREHASA